MLKETLTLLAAGYSKKEIDAMREADKKAAADAAAQQAEESKKAEETKKAEQAQIESEAQARIKELETQLASANEDLKKAQASNVGKSVQGSASADNEQAHKDLLSHLADLM